MAADLGPTAPASRRGPWARRGPAGLVLLALVVLVAVLLTARSCGDHAATSPTGSPTEASGAALPVGLDFGRQLVGRSSAEVAAALDDAAAMHLRWIRVDFSWADLQPTQSGYAWSSADRVVAAARQRHLSVLGLITYTPAWARTAGCHSFVCPPASAERFADFAAAVVHRYAPQGVTTYQLWNEPNIGVFWQHPDPAAYGQLLRTAVSRMHAEQSDVKVLFGGLAYADSKNGDLDPASYLRIACAAHGCPVDGVGYDPYTYPQVPSADGHPATPWNLLTSGGSLRTAVDDVLGPSTPLWVTQFGAPTRYAGSKDPRLVDGEQQSRIITAGLQLAQADPRVGGFFVNAWRDERSTQLRAHFGLWTVDGRPRPAVAALTRLLGAQPATGVTAR